ncbi:MAG: hypothetical protein LBM01_01170 [Christensenellaceae bacterium]|jgi:hypothetical protein|nr:hypothetical protein [Christensenellaceae bacterium]
METHIDKIITNTDKVKLALHDYRDTKTLGGNILSWFTLIATFTITLFTVKFENAFGLSADMIKTIIFMLLIITVFVFFYNIVKLVYYKIHSSNSYEKFVATLEGNEYEREHKKDLSQFGETIIQIFRWIFEIIAFLLPLLLFVMFILFNVFIWKSVVAYFPIIFLGLLINVCWYVLIFVELTWEKFNEFWDSLFHGEFF